MKFFSNSVLTLGAPVLLILALFGFVQRKGADQFQIFPALLVGTGLIVSGYFSRKKKRSRLLMQLRNIDRDTNQ